MANGLILPAMRPSPPYLGGEKHWKKQEGIMPSDSAFMAGGLIIRHPAIGGRHVLIGLEEIVDGLPDCDSGRPSL